MLKWKGLSRTTGKEITPYPHIKYEYRQSIPPLPETTFMNLRNLKEIPLT
jgi:hypothetical protein